MEPDSTTSVVSAEPADERKEVSMDSSSKCLFCEKDLSKDEYLTHLKVSNTSIILEQYYLHLLFFFKMKSILSGVPL